MVSTRRSKNSDGEGSTVTVGSSVPNDGGTTGFPMKHQQLQQLPTKVTAVTTGAVPRRHGSSSVASAAKVLAVVVAKSGSTVNNSNNNKNNNARPTTSRAAATTTTAKSTKSSQTGGTQRRKAGSIPIKKTKPCWKKGRAGVSNKMLQLQKNPNITIVQYQTGVLYLHKEGNRRRAEYVQTK